MHFLIVFILLHSYKFASCHWVIKFTDNEDCVNQTFCFTNFSQQYSTNEMYHPSEVLFATMLEPVSDTRNIT